MGKEVGRGGRTFCDMISKNLLCDTQKDLMPCHTNSSHAVRSPTTPPRNSIRRLTLRCVSQKMEPVVNVNAKGLRDGDAGESSSKSPPTHVSSPSRKKKVPDCSVIFAVRVDMDAHDRNQVTEGHDEGRSRANPRDALPQAQRLPEGTPGTLLLGGLRTCLNNAIKTFCCDTGRHTKGSWRRVTGRVLATSHKRFWANVLARRLDPASKRGATGPRAVT